MERLRLYYDKYSFLLYCIIVFFARLPPFYIFFIRQSLYSTHNIARSLIFILFLLLLLFNKNWLKDKWTVALTLLYLISQSVSLLGAINVVEFLYSYKDTLTGIVFFLVSLGIVTSKQRVHKLLQLVVITTIINVTIQFFIYFFLQGNRLIFEAVFYEKYLENLLIHANRGRFFLDMYEAALIPLALLFLLQVKKMVYRIFFLCLTLFIMVFTLLSNFRIHFVVMIVSLFSGAYFLPKKKSVIIVLIGIIILILIPTILISRSTTGYDVIGRLLLTEQEDLKTIVGRWEYWTKAKDMGLSSPLFGIGLGNFYDNFFPKQTKLFSLFNEKNDLSRVTLTHPHNIFFAHFASTGFFGLVALIVLLIFFLKRDIYFVLRNGAEFNSTNLIIVCFWSLFVFSLSGIDSVIQYQILFWLLRALILRFQSQKIEKRGGQI